MNKSFLILIIFLSGLRMPVFAQDSLATSSLLQSSAEQYLDARLQRDWPRLMEFIYPAAFQHVTPEELTATLENGEGNGLAPAPRQLTIARINAPQTIGEERFALIETSALSELHLDGDQFREERLINMVRRNFEQKYGTENVEYLPEESLLRIYTSAYLIGVTSSDSDDWRFLERSPEFQQLWIKCLPPEASSLTWSTSN